MTTLLRSTVLLLAFCCPALASAPTPQGIAEIQRLLGYDVLYVHIFNAKLDGAAELKSLAPDKKACLSGMLRAPLVDALSEEMGRMFVDQQTVDAWIAFAATPGGGKMFQALRASVTARVTGLPAPDMAAVQAAMNPGELNDVSEFEHSPAASVLAKKFPDIDATPSDPAQTRQALERCGIIPGKA